MAAVQVETPLRRSNLFSQHRRFLPLHEEIHQSESEHNEQSINQMQNSLNGDSSEWRYWVSLFAKDLEYDYILAINDSKGRKISMYEEVRVKHSLVGINFHAAEKTPAERIKIKQLSKGDEKEASLPDVLLYWDETRSFLFGVRQCDIDVY